MLWGSFQRDTVLHSVRHKKHNFSCLVKMRSRDDLIIFCKHLHAEEISDDCRSYI